METFAYFIVYILPHYHMTLPREDIVQYETSVRVCQTRLWVNFSALPCICVIYHDNSRDIICSEKRTDFREHSSRKTVSFEEQIMSKDTEIAEHIFTPNVGYCVYYPSNLLRNTRSFERWGISLGYSQF